MNTTKKSVTYSATNSEGKIFLRSDVRPKTHAVIFYRRDGAIISEFYMSKENAMKEVAKHKLWQSRSDFGKYHMDRFEIVEAIAI
jgi:hypothetical protein